MIFQHFLLDCNEVNAFILACSDSREAVLIDVGLFDPAIPAFVEEHDLILNTIFITHDHYDHTGGLAEAAKHFGATVISGTSQPGGYEAQQVAHGDKVYVGNLVGEVVATPGHTPDGLSLIFPGMVFAGDALFAGSVGGTASPELAEQQIDHIRKNLFTLPVHYEVHVGHGPSTTIGIERACNPFFV